MSKTITKEKPLTAKQASFIEYYCNPASKTYNNCLQSMIRAGYDERYASHNTNQVMGNNGVKQGIEAYKAKTAEKIDYNKDIALKNILNLIDHYETQVKNGVVAAGSLLLQCYKELNEVCGHHNAQPDINIMNNINHNDAVSEREQLKERLARIERMESLPSCIESD